MHGFDIAGLRGYRARGARKARHAEAERLSALDAEVSRELLMDPQAGGAPEKSVSMGEFSFPPAKPSPPAPRPPLYHGQPQGTPAFMPDVKPPGNEVRT